MDAAKNAYATLERPGDKQAFLTGMIEVWASNDADGALGFVRSLPSSFFKPGIAEQALAILARSDAKKALRLLPQIVSGKHQDNAALKIIATLATYDLKSALDYCAARPSDRAEIAFAEMAVAAATREDAAAVVDAVTNRRDLTPASREAALGAIAGVWAMQSGPAATAWAEGQLTSTGSSRPLELALVNWATDDAPSAAEALFAHLGNGWAARVAMEIASSWADQEPASAAAWVTGLPPSPTRDAAIEGFATAQSQSDPLGTLRWAMALPAEEPARGSAIVQASSAFRDTEQSTFDAFVGTLSNAQRSELQQILETAPAPRTALFMDSAVVP